MFLPVSTGRKLMLLTNKAEILGAMNKELEGASASSIKWLADTFNVPMTPKRNYSKEKPAVVSAVFSHSGKWYVLKLNPDDILQLEEQNKAFPVKLHGRKNKYWEHRKPKRRLPQK
jgi:hypothetical protein